MSADTSVRKALPTARFWTSPFAVLLAIYSIYLLVVYSSIWKYVSWELMNLGTRIVGFRPSLLTLWLYLYGALTLVFGFVGGRWVAMRIDGARRPESGLVPALSRLRERVEKLPVVRRLGLLYTIGLVGWLIAIAANGLVVLATGSISLVSIGSRWAQSPVLVLVAASQSFFIPAMLVGARTKPQRAFAVVAFVIGVLALGLLGARNLPAKLLIAMFLASAYVVKPKNLWRLVVIFVLLLVIAMGVVGALTKSGIYGPSATTGLAVALTYSDSAGSFYNLDRIVKTTPSTGAYGGKLLVDSVKAAIPGLDADYANYQLGKYLTGREYFMIGAEKIDRSVSLSPTLIGAPYADYGVVGIAIQMALLGFLFGYFQWRSTAQKWAIPFLVLLAAYVINGVNAGVHNPHAIIVVSLSVLVIAIDAYLGRGRDSAAGVSGPSVGALT